jgi:lipopolysaccharide transport system ATP-binding protein
MAAVQSLCSRCILLEGGRVKEEGPSDVVTRSYYVGASGVLRARADYQADPRKQIQIRRLDICHRDGTPLDRVDLNEPFIVRIEYEFRVPSANVVIGCTITSCDTGQPLISLSDPELDLSRLERREAGRYVARIQIPPKILNTGIYQVRVGAVSHKTILDVVDDVSFEVIDSVGIVQGIGYERKSSLLSMQLPWEVSRLGTTGATASNPECPEP